MLLCRVGYRVLTATTGAEALQLASKIKGIDLRLCQVKMRGMRGDELAARGAALHPSIPDVLMASSNEPIKTTEPFDVLAKLFTVTELRDTVCRALQAPPMHALELHAA